MSSNILIIREKQGVTKLQALVDAIHESVSTGALEPGDPLPSINELSRISGYSRDTVVKAYNLLKQQSLIESTPAKGFFVSGVAPRVFMLLDDFSAFKEQLYRAFRDNLPGSYSVDLLFHHYNPMVFEQLTGQAAGRYSMYIIMNISNKQLHPALSKIDPNKLLVLDMGDESDTRASYILQNFDSAVSRCLEQGAPLFEKYSELIYIYSETKTPHPIDTTAALASFCETRGLGFHVTGEHHSECMAKGQVYFVITENDLVQVLKGCRISGLSLGSDIGIIAYNDTPMKEIAGNGITVISTDFNDMGLKAAEFVKNKRKIREIIPTSLIIRSSL